MGLRWIVYETHKDDEALATGTHKGSNGASALYDKADFKSCGVIPGLAIYNTTQGTNGLTVTITETSVTDDTNTWDNGDSYAIYKTAVKDSVISTIAVDKSRGWKVTRRNELDSNGWLPKDHDIDVDEDGFYIDPPPFGPGQPEDKIG